MSGAFKFQDSRRTDGIASQECYTYSEKLDELTKEPQVSNWNCTLQMGDHMIYSCSWLWSTFENTVFMVRTSKDFVTTVTKYGEKVIPQNTVKANISDYWHLEQSLI